MAVLGGVATGRQWYDHRHRDRGPTAPVAELDTGALRYWSTSGTLDREQRAELAAEHTTRTDPDGSRARDNLAASLSYVRHAHTERQQRAALRQLGYLVLVS